jgi:hypothetical protein
LKEGIISDGLILEKEEKNAFMAIDTSQPNAVISQK